MIVMIIFLLIGISILEIRRTNFLLNPLSVFLIEWSVIISCSSLHLFGLYEPKRTTIYLFFLGILMFIVGYYIQSTILNNYKFVIGRSSVSSYMYEPRYKMLIIAAVLCIVYYIFYFYQVYKNVGSLNLWTIQQFLRKQTDVIDSKYVRALGAFIFGPVSFSLPIIVSVDFWFGKREKKLLLLTIILTFVQMLATASRITLLCFFLYIVTIGIFKLTKSNRVFSSQEKQRIRKLLIFSVVFGIIAFVVMSLSRKLSVFKSLYLQISIPPIMYDIWIDKIDSMKLWGCGEASLNGFFFPVLYVFQKFVGMKNLLPNMQAVYDLINYTDSLWVEVGTGITANAYVSIFWFLYLDIRIFGIILGMFIFGIYCGSSYNQMNKNTNCKNLSLYCICILSVIFSLVRMQYARANFALALLFLAVFAFKLVEKKGY